MVSRFPIPQYSLDTSDLHFRRPRPTFKIGGRSRPWRCCMSVITATKSAWIGTAMRRTCIGAVMRRTAAQAEAGAAEGGVRTSRCVGSPFGCYAYRRRRSRRQRRPQPLPTLHLRTAAARLRHSIRAAAARGGLPLPTSLQGRLELDRRGQSRGPPALQIATQDPKQVHPRCPIMRYELFTRASCTAPHAAARVLTQQPYKPV